MKKNTWIYKVFLITFILSIIFSGITTYLSNNFNNIILISFIILLVIMIGVIFDMIGTSALTSKESSFHAMNSKRIKGAKEALYLINNSVTVSSICNDIVGDVCGIVSGGLGAVLAILVSDKFNINIVIVSVLLSALVSSLTVGSKAICKGIAVNNSDRIVFMVAKIIKKFGI